MVVAYRADHRLIPPLTLIKRHIERFPDCTGKRIRAVRIDQHRALSVAAQLMRCTGKFRQDQHAGVLGRRHQDHGERVEDRARREDAGRRVLGRQAEALRTYQEYRAALADAGLEPTDKAVQLDARIARNDPGLDDTSLTRPLRGYRIEERLDRKGDRIDRTLDRRSDRALENGHDLRAEKLDRKGDRIDNRLDRKGERIDRKLDRKGQRIDRRTDRRKGGK